MSGGGGGGGWSAVPGVSEWNKLSPEEKMAIQGNTPVGALYTGGKKLLGGGLFGGKGSNVSYGSDIPTPKMSKFEGITRGGKLEDRFALSGKVDDIAARGDTTGLVGLRQAALTPSSESPWMKMQLEKQQLEQSGLLGSAAQQAASQGAQARSGLAMRGGLRGGAAERLAGQSANDLALARQGVLQQGALTRAGLGAEAEQQRLSMLSQLPGAELSHAQYLTDVDRVNQAKNLASAQQDVQSMLGQQSAKNEFNRFKFGEQMKAKGAGMSAQAMENAGKK